MAKMSIQGGVDNYLGKQKTINNIPIKWKSRPGKPATELAYITKAEKDLLLKKDLHGSLKDGPNTGPGGIMSLDSAGGSYGSPGSGTGRDSGNSGRESGSENNRNQSPPSRTTPPPDRGPNEPDNKPGRTPIDTSRYTTDTQDRNNRAAIERGRKEKAAADKKKKIEEEKKKKADEEKKKKADEEKKKKEAKEKKIEDAKKVGESKNPFARFASWNKNAQLQANKDLARKRAFQKYQDIEQYVSPFDEYGLTAEELADKVAADPTYGYDFSDLDVGKQKLGSNIGTSLEKYRLNKYDVNSPIKGRFSFLNKGFDKFRPDTQITAMNTLAKARAYNKAVDNPNIGGELERLKNLGRTEDQIKFIEQGGRENNDYTPIANIPVIPVEDEEETIDYRFGNTQDVGRDVTLGYLADGGRAGKAEGGIMELRARRAFGGIMDRVTGRKAYGLGSIFKSVKKAVGKVLSSDVGKLAIMGAGIYYGGGGRLPFTEAFKKKGFGGAKMFGENSFFSKSNPLLFSDGEFNPYKAAALTTVGGALMGPAKVDQMPGSSNGESSIDPLTGQPATPAEKRQNIELAKLEANGDPVKLAAIDQAYNNMLNLNLPDNRPYKTYNAANGGRIGRAEGGLMDLGGMEKDYRAEGGFVPIGEYEKKDDVPARLSVNEFVFTADAVRGAGQGDIDKGAEIMENMMKNLENGGTVSEESQGNNGAQQMFETSERLGEIL
jgi:hypothetical protein